MKLGVARLCLDCDEVHDEERCPTCASEVFAFLDSLGAALERAAGPIDAAICNIQISTLTARSLARSQQTRARVGS